MQPPPNQPYYGNAPANQGYGGGAGPQGAPNQPYNGNAPANPGYGGGYYTGPQGSEYQADSRQAPPTGAPPPPTTAGPQGQQPYGGSASQPGLRRRLLHRPAGRSEYQAPGRRATYGAPPPPPSRVRRAPDQPYTGNPPPNPGYGGGYYTGPQGAPNQPYPASAGQPGLRRRLLHGRRAPRPAVHGNAPANPGYGGGYYTGPQGAYGGQSGYYTGQPNAGQVQTYPSQGGEAYNAQTGETANAERPVVVVPAHIASARRYIRRTTISNVYEVVAARIALRRSRTPEVRDFANRMMDEHRQAVAIITQASAQAGLPQRPMLDRTHRAMLNRLRRVPDSDFDRVYMNQQLVAHMNAAAVQEGYLRDGDNPALLQAAAQLRPIVQQHLDMAWADTGMPDRLAELRNSEFAMLDQSAGRGQTYRGYTVVGPTAGEEPNEGAAGYGYRGQYRRPAASTKAASTKAASTRAASTRAASIKAATTAGPTTARRRTVPPSSRRPTSRPARAPAARPERAAPQARARLERRGRPATARARACRGPGATGPPRARA